jgi:hypothetical protein
MRRGGGSAGSVLLAAMADGEWRLGYEGVARDPLEVGGGSAGAHPVLSTVVRLSGEKPAMGARTGGHRGCRSGR